MVTLADCKFIEFFYMIDDLIKVFDKTIKRHFLCYNTKIKDASTNEVTKQYVIDAPQKLYLKNT